MQGNNGAKPASGELTRASLPFFIDTPEANIIHDDLILAAPSEEHHDKALDKVLQIIHQSGLTLNPEKCIFKSSDKVLFWRMIISDKGVMPDPNKVSALQHARRPQSKEEIMSFLCMVSQTACSYPI